MSGIGIGIGVGFNGVAGLLRPEADAYIDRVEADGGTVFLNSREISIRLNSITCRQFPQFIVDYFIRVADDNGTIFLTHKQTRDRIAQITCL